MLRIARKEEKEGGKEEVFESRALKKKKKS